VKPLEIAADRGAGDAQLASDLRLDSVMQPQGSQQFLNCPETQHHPEPGDVVVTPSAART
jgi:hypothetical protein